MHSLDNMVINRKEIIKPLCDARKILDEMHLYVLAEKEYYNTKDPTYLKLQQEILMVYMIYIVSSYEMTIKNIFIEYANLHSEKFRVYVEKALNRLNGRIKYSDLCKHVDRFGGNAKNDFLMHMRRMSKILNMDNNSVSKIYDNIIDNRNEFVHNKTVNKYITIGDLRREFNISKIVIYSLFVALFQKMLY